MAPDAIRWSDMAFIFRDAEGVEYKHPVGNSSCRSKIKSAMKFYIRPLRGRGGIFFF